MAISRSRDKVRDGYLGDLPEPIRTKVMNIHKLIRSTVDSIIEDTNYDDLKSSRWAMSCLDDFCVMPKDKSDIGSVRVFKSGPKKFRCSIQITGQFRNHQYGWIEELIHDFIKNVHATLRPQVRKKYDMTIINEGRTGNPFERFTIETSAKVAEEIWNLLEGTKTKTMTEDYEELGSEEPGMDNLFTEVTKDKNTIDCGVRKLPKGLAHIVSDQSQAVKSLMETLVEDPMFSTLKECEDYTTVLNFVMGKTKKGSIGRTIITKQSDGTFTGEIQITPMPDGPVCKNPECQKCFNKMLSKIKSKVAGDFNKKNPGKKLILTGPKNQQYIIIALDPSYAEKLYNYIKSPRAYPMTEATEAPTIDYNTDMTEAEAKRNMRTLSQGLINDFKTNKSKKMTQYTANIYANIITKNLLPRWAGSFRKFSISLDDYQSFHTVEFKVPKMTQDFVGRFIHGRENLDGFLHRQAEIKMKISPRVFHTMKSPDDAYNFFKAAITYYDKKVGKAGEKLMAEAMKLTPSMKQLVGTTKLSGIVTFPMTLLFVFDDVDMSNKNTFQLSQEDIRTVSSFIRNISSHYAAPEKEKKQIVDDVQKMVKTLREACSIDENLAEIGYLPEAVTQLFAGIFDKQLKEAAAEWEDGNVDYMAMRAPRDPKVKVLTEAFGVKKLKKIPADLVAYIQIETEAIKDANDKMMISSYCLSKIEIVEWYIELLNVGSKKYVVPHTKPWLENMRTQLLACFKKIMATPIPKADRPIIDIKYPPGYEG